MRKSYLRVIVPVSHSAHMRRSRPDMEKQPYNHADGCRGQEHDRHLPRDDLEEAGLQVCLSFAVALADGLREKSA
jgi:hypothetical protein